MDTRSLGGAIDLSRPDRGEEGHPGGSRGVQYSAAAQDPENQHRMAELLRHGPGNPAADARLPEAFRRYRQSDRADASKRAAGDKPVPGKRRRSLQGLPWHRVGLMAGGPQQRLFLMVFRYGAFPVPFAVFQSAPAAMWGDRALRLIFVFLTGACRRFERAAWVVGAGMQMLV